MFQGIEFYVVPANNHASYPHSLPMLATHPDAGEPFVQPVVSAEGLARWVKKRQALSSREEAYLTLVDGPVRRAWVWLFLYSQECDADRMSRSNITCT